MDRGRMVTIACLLAALFLVWGCGSRTDGEAGLTVAVAPSTEAEDTEREISTPTAAPAGFRAEVDGVELSLVWDLSLKGDYNNDRAVSGMDVFPLAVHFGEESDFNGHTATEPGNNCIDGNRDGMLNGLDLFSIAVNFNLRSSGWFLYGAPAFTGPWDRFEAEPLEPGGECVGDFTWVYPGTDWAGHWFYIRTWDAVEAVEGELSEVVGEPGSAAYTHLRVEPQTHDAVIGDDVQFSAWAVFDDLSELNVTAGATWESSAPPVAEVSSAGLASALREGTCGIIASFVGHGDAGVLNVGPAGPWSKTRVHSFDQDPYGGPRLLQDSDGNLAVVYSGVESGTGHLTMWVATESGASWDVETAVDGGGTGLDPSPAVSAGGQFGILNMEEALDATPLHYTFKDGTWQDEVVDSDATVSFWGGRYISLGFSGETPVAAYSTWDIGLDEVKVKYAERSAPGLWTVETLDAQYAAMSLDLVVDPANDTAHVFYSPEPVLDFESWVVHAWKESGGPWQQEIITDVLEDFPIGLSAVLDSEGSPSVSYFVELSQVLYGARYDSTEGWQAEEIYASGQYGALAINPATDRPGVAFLVIEGWVEDVWFGESDELGAWDCAQIQEPPEDGQLWLDCALIYQSDGTPVVSWLVESDEDPGQSYLMVARGNE